MNIQQFESVEFYSHAYWYVGKTDTNLYYSSVHPPLEEMGSPRIKKCTTTLISKILRAGTLPGGESSSSTTPSTGVLRKKQRRIGKLTLLEIGMFTLKHNIKKGSEIFAAAKSCYAQTMLYTVPDIWLT